MMFEFLSYDDFITEIANNKSAFICGNGFSINFDSSYSASNLAKSLFNTHYHIKSFAKYESCGNNKYKEIMKSNYKSAMRVINRINNEKDFISLFDDAIKFAQALLQDDIILSWLNDNGYNMRLTFGLEQLDLMAKIVEQAKRYGVLNVNYEYWTIIIYYIIVMSKSPNNIFEIDKNNKFVQAVLAGNVSPIEHKESGTDLFISAVTNGMYIYLRFLFAGNILLKGKSYDVTKLDNWEKYDTNVINSFLSNFDYLVTTNYDMILETLTQKDVFHLHGCYFKTKKVFLYETLTLTYDLKDFDLSTIIIGDFFLSKSFYQLTAKMANSKFPNTPTKVYSDILEDVIKTKKSNIIVIFGLNVDNDYHILRNIQIELEAGGVKNPHIIYCYYSDNDLDSFKKSYEECITYSDYLSDYVKNNIRVSVVDSKELKEIIFKLKI